jgi:hypothetical protein
MTILATRQLEICIVKNFYRATYFIFVSRYELKRQAHYIKLTLKLDRSCRIYVDTDTWQRMHTRNVQQYIFHLQTAPDRTMDNVQNCDSVMED